MAFVWYIVKLTNILEGKGWEGGGNTICLKLIGTTGGRAFLIHLLYMAEYAASLTDAVRRFCRFRRDVLALGPSMLYTLLPH